MKISITLQCPNCQSKDIKKNGHKYNGKQNYQSKVCKRQFISDYLLTYKGCHSSINQKIELMLVRNVGIRDIAEIEKVSLQKVLSVLCKPDKILKPKKTYYDKIEVDKFWTYVEKKNNKVWLIYAYDRETKEIIAWVWGKRNYKTVKKLREKLLELGINFGAVYTDDWASFLKAFNADNHIIGKKGTVGIEGNNCLIRHRIRRGVRKTCCFSKKLLNHFKAFNLAFFYINFGYV